MKFPAFLILGGLALWAAPAFAQSYSFTIFAGMPPPTGHQDGVGPAARFHNPVAIALDAAGNAYVADRENAVVRKITPAGAVSTLAGLPGATGATDGTGASARFTRPTGVAVDAAGNVFVTDATDHTVRRISPAGVVTTLAGLAGTPGSADGTGPVARFRNPSGIAVDAAGNVYISDTGNATLRKMTPAGAVSTLAGTAGLTGNIDGAGASARFTSPAGLTMDADGTLYAVDTVSHVVRKITGAGAVSTLAGLPGTAGNANGVGAGARFNTPFGIAADAGGTLYVADTVNESIRRITPDGTVSTFAGSLLGGSVDGTGANARFFRPQGIAIDAAGNVHVADTFNHSIRKLTPGAVSSTFAGPGGNFGHTDATGTSARFNRPRGISMDSQGNLFVSESFNNTVRKITPAGAVSTFAGQPGVVNYQDGTGTAALFGNPGGLTVDHSDQIYIVDQLFNALRRISPAGVVQTWAGTPGLAPGASDGPFNVGRFNRPQGVAVDRDGVTYVADSGNHTIRRILPTTEMNTLAGLGGISGSADGSGAGARFFAPSDIAIDSAGNLYVTDYNNSTIRKITPAGLVTTLAGEAGSRGAVDGQGSAARFDNADGIAVDAAGNVFVSDSNNHLVRKITPSGVVTTIGGLAGTSGVAAGTGSSARFFVPSGITVDPNGVLYVVSGYGNVIMRGALDTIPSISAHPQSQSIALGGSATLSVTAAGGGLSYQWKLNGAVIPGANGASFTVSNATNAAAGDYTVEITNSAGTRTSNPARLTIGGAAVQTGRIVNLAIRSRAGTDAQTLIVGVNIGGAGTAGMKSVLMRGVGPTLSVFGVPGVLDDPKLELYSGETKLRENDDWTGDAQISAIGPQVGAFDFASSTSKDAALYSTTFSSGSYSMWITGKSGATGVALAEIYDATPAAAFTASTPRLTNVSARTQVGSGDDILIAGFAIAGQTPKKMLIRAVGPGLVPFGVEGVLANPKLELFSADTKMKINENDDWNGEAALADAFRAVAAFDLPAASRDAALLVTLEPGTYTAQVSGVGNTTGVALVEVYEVP